MNERRCSECQGPAGPGGGLPVWHHLPSGEDKLAALCPDCESEARSEGRLAAAVADDDGW